MARCPVDACFEGEAGGIYHKGRIAGKLKSGCVVAGVPGRRRTQRRARPRIQRRRHLAIIGRGDLDDKDRRHPDAPSPCLASPRRGAAGQPRQADGSPTRPTATPSPAAARRPGRFGGGRAAFCLAGSIPARPRLAPGPGRPDPQDSTYRCDELKSKKDESKKGRPQAHLRRQEQGRRAARAAIRRGGRPSPRHGPRQDPRQPAGQRVHPGLPRHHRAQAGKDHKIKVEVLDRDDMEKLGMGALLSVARGSHEPPVSSSSSTRAARPGDKPVVLVGKASPSTPAASPSSPARAWTR